MVHMDAGEQHPCRRAWASKKQRFESAVVRVNSPCGMPVSRQRKLEGPARCKSPCGVPALGEHQLQGPARSRSPCGMAALGERQSEGPARSKSPCGVPALEELQPEGPARNPKAKGPRRTHAPDECKRGAALEEKSPSSKRSMKSVIAETPSGKISFFEAGDESDLPVLVLLPGLFCSAQRLMKAMMPLAEKTKLLAVEWRGHGKSNASKDFQVRDLADDVMAVIRARFQGANAFKGTKLCVLGHSMGARVFWSMMDNYKQELTPMLEGVAIIDQGPTASTGRSSMGPADHAHAKLKHASQLIGHSKKEMVSTLQGMWGDVDCGFVHSQSEMADWLKFVDGVNHIAGASLHWDALSSDYSHVVQSLNTKVLLMVGDATLGPSAIYERMGAAIPPPGAHFALFAGGTHCPHYQREHLPKMIGLVEQMLNGSLEVNTPQGGLRPASQQAVARQPLGTLQLLNAPLNANNLVLKPQGSFMPPNVLSFAGSRSPRMPGCPPCLLTACLAA